jgi:ABC-2 type transport system ATP-binding protein
MSMHAQSMMEPAKVAMIGGVTSADWAIRVDGLRKSYGTREALRGVAFEVARGEVFGLLGPNGAGKTTTVEILEGYRDRSAGEVSVLGEDPARRGHELRARVGIVLQSCGMHPHLTVREAVAHWASLYPRPRPVDEVLGVTGLQDAADRRTRALSGGQLRRLDFALALVGDPELIFLDEPTTGFDPAARRQAWEVVDGLRALGKTIVLTTHYMEEAERLADRIVVMARGEIVAQGTPATLGGRDRAAAIVTFTLPPGAEPPPQGADAHGRVTLRTERPMADLHALTGWALERGLELTDLEIRRPTLEDVYLELTR